MVTLDTRKHTVNIPNSIYQLESNNITNNPKTPARTTNNKTKKNKTSGFSIHTRVDVTTTLLKNKMPWCGQSFFYKAGPIWFLQSGGPGSTCRGCRPASDLPTIYELPTRLLTRDIQLARTTKLVSAFFASHNASPNREYWFCGGFLWVEVRECYVACVIGLVVSWRRFFSGEFSMCNMNRWVHVRRPW